MSRGAKHVDGRWLVTDGCPCLEVSMIDNTDYELLRRLGVTLEVDYEGFWEIPSVLVDENDE